MESRKCEVVSLNTALEGFFDGLQVRKTLYLKEN